MKPRNSVVFAFLLAATAMAAGCHEEPAVASPACVELEKTTNPARRAELLKRCPRVGPEFKRSPVKNW